MSSTRLNFNHLNGRNDLKGLVVVGFQVPSRGSIDELYVKLTQADYPRLQPPYDTF
jgi:hypothetical protein